MRQKILHSSYEPLTIVTFGVLVLGVILGCVIAVGSYGDGLNAASQNIYTSLQGLNSGYNRDRTADFLNSIFRYSRVIALVWVLSFLHAGFVFQLFTLGIRGLYVGFGVSVIVMKFGAGGLLLSIFLIILQNVFFILILFFIIARCQKREGLFSEKALVLALSLLCALVISLYEVYVSPPICLFVFNRILS